MKPSRIPASASPAAALRRMRVPGAFAAFAALILSAISCSDTPTKVAEGTSSGVDNPAVTVTYTGADGVAARITGQLDVYAADQNPAVAPDPLISIAVQNAPFTNLTGADLNRVKQSLSKRAAFNKVTASAVDSVRIAFNIVVKTRAGTGGMVIGLVYDSTHHAVLRRDSTVKGVLLQPKPLVRYEARVAKDSVHGADCRVFVPGSPYLATLVDSTFVLENVPQDLLPLRLIGSDGKIYPIPDSLDPANLAPVLHPGTKPVGSLDTAHAQDTIPAFSIAAPAPRETYLDVPNFLEATLKGISASDPRLSVLWKVLPDSGRPEHLDSSFHGGDTLGGPRPAPYAELVSPTSLRTEVRFKDDGIYHFVVTATVGTRTAWDTTVVSVRRLPPPEPKILHPAPAESVVIAKPFNVQWQMPGRGPYTIEFSNNNGEKWVPLATHYVSKDGLQFYVWTATAEMGPSDRCLLRVSDEIDTGFHAETPGVFHLIH